MAKILSAEPEDEAIRQRLARLQNGHADARSDAERLRGESRRVAEHYASVQAVTRAQWDARRAALNLLEDAEEARSAERRELAERRRADAALRASEEKYRALFERMNEGYCVIEMMFDAAGQPEDFVFLDANPAFAVQIGMKMTGRRVREAIPGYEQFWLDQYGRVATTGEPMRCEGFVGGLGRWFEASAFRLGGDDSLRVAVLFTNITERKQTEERLRRAAATDAFRVALGDALRPLHDPTDIQIAAAEILGRHLGASRVHYSEIDGEFFVVGCGYADGVPPFTGRHRYGTFGAVFAETLRAGKTLVMVEVASHPGLEADQRQALLERSVASFVGVPLMKNGRHVGTLAVNQAHPRVWTEDELALVGETAERIWTSVERARTQAALQESEARLSTAVGLARLGIGDWDWSTDEMRGNATRFSMCGLNPALGALSARQFVDLLHPEDRERVWPRIVQGLETRGEYSEIFRIVRPDGLVRWISEAGRVSTWQDGKPLLVNSVLFDITTHREAEATVRESEARFRTLADAVPQLIWANEADGKSTYFNQRWFDFSGLGVEESVGPGWQAIVHPDDASGSVAGWQRALASGETFDAEYRLRRADGEYRWHLGRIVPLKDEAGRVLSWFGTATDIHDLKDAEAAFAAAQERLRLIVESAHEHAIISLDRECRVTSWNPGAERMFGYRAGEIIGRPIEPIFTPEDRAGNLLQTETRRALEDGQAVGERWHVRRDGTRLWTNCALMPMTARPGGEPIGFVKILRDETEALESRQALEQTSLFLQDALRDTERARAEAEAAGQAKDHFLAVLSHELRTPLMPIQMALGTLSRRHDLPAPVRAAHEMITRNVELEAHFIDDMLDMTRIARGKMEIVSEPMDLHEAARRAVEVSLPDLEAKGQRLTVALDAADHRLNADFARLQQAMWNLLKNASKFTPGGGAISLRTRNEMAGQIVVEITDSGIGMEPAVIERVFKPFEQADVSITQRFGGLGLGLAIAKGTVDAHGGDLRASSAGPGQGATFTMCLPLPRPNANF